MRYFKIIIILAIYYPSITMSQNQLGLDIDGENSFDSSGESISLNSTGTILAVGSVFNDGNNTTNSGHVRVYEFNSNNWIQIGNDIDGENQDDQFGRSVSLSDDGTILAIGATGNDSNGNNSGQVKVYEYNNGNWTQLGNNINGEAESDTFGNQVSLNSDGSILAIGAMFNDGNGQDSGHVKVFEYNAGNWIQLGNNIEGESASDFSGISVSLSANGNILAIGATRNNGNGNFSGHVRVFEFNANSWVQIGDDINGEDENDRSGWSIDLNDDGTIIAIGAIDNNGTNGFSSGHVRVYQNSSNNWIQLGNDIDGEDNFDSFGYSLDLNSSGNILVVGSRYNNGNGNSSGHVRVYKYTTDWIQQGNDIDGEAPFDSSGASVSLNFEGNILAIGATENDGGGTNSGHVRVYDLTNLLSINEYTFDEIKIFPNPAKESFNITEKLNTYKEVIVYDTLGNIVIKSTARNISTKSLKPGLYLIKIIIDKNSIVNKKLIINR